MASFVVIYDANVLYPAHLRDLVVRLARTGLFQAKVDRPHPRRVLRDLTENRPDLDPNRLARTRQLMCDAVPDCLVEGYEPLIDGLELPDPDNRHVLAAAVLANAQVIVTWNLKDFPAEQLDDLGIEAQSPDEFVSHVIDLAPGRVVQTITEMADALEAPPMTFDDVVALLRRDGLGAALVALNQQCDRICDQSTVTANLVEAVR